MVRTMTTAAVPEPLFDFSYALLVTRGGQHWCQRFTRSFAVFCSLWWNCRLSGQIETKCVLRTKSRTEKVGSTCSCSLQRSIPDLEPVLQSSVETPRAVRQGHVAICENGVLSLFWKGPP